MQSPSTDDADAEYGSGDRCLDGEFSTPEAMEATSTARRTGLEHPHIVPNDRRQHHRRPGNRGRQPSELVGQSAPLKNGTSVRPRPVSGRAFAAGLMKRFVPRPRWPEPSICAPRSRPSQSGRPARGFRFCLGLRIGRRNDDPSVRTVERRKIAAMRLVRLGGPAVGPDDGKGIALRDVASAGVAAGDCWEGRHS